jgi:type III secretory pathway component EscV
MQEEMLLRLTLVLTPAVVLTAVDLAMNAAFPTRMWDFHERSQLWSALTAALVVVLFLLAVLPSLLVAASAGVVAGGVLGNLISAREHGGRVPNPIVVGSVALNVADIVVLAGVPLLVFALARVSIRHRDSLIPPRRWEAALRRRLRL